MRPSRLAYGSSRCSRSSRTSALGAQLAGVYQRDINFLGTEGQTTTWYSAGARVSYGVTEHFKVLARSDSTA